MLLNIFFSKVLCKNRNERSKLKTVGKLQCFNSVLLFHAENLATKVFIKSINTISLNVFDAFFNLCCCKKWAYNFAKERYELFWFTLPSWRVEQCVHWRFTEKIY